MQKYLLTISLLSSMFNATAQVTTVAGTGTPGYVDGSLSIAQLDLPNGIVFDKAGNYYVADFGNCVIRKITLTGVMSTYAGSGTRGYLDGHVTTAQFNQPWGLAIDTADNIYVGDAGNGRIRKITPGGVVSTLAGSGFDEYRDGTGSVASFSYPAAIAIDLSGNIYVSDHGNQRIRKVNPDGVVSTFAGSGIQGFADGPVTSAQFSYPNSIAIAPSGDIYLTDRDNGAVRKISGGMVTTIAGGTLGYADGKGRDAKFLRPHGIILDDAGNLYIADTENDRIRKIASDSTVTTLAGSYPGYKDGPCAEALFSRPKCIAKDTKGNLYITDESNHSVRKITFTTTIVPEVRTFTAAVYPNPAKDQISVTCTVSEPYTHIKLYNTFGQIVLQQSAATLNHELKEQIDISGLPPGEYVLKIISGATTESSMILKH